jgi:hypothetical protein
MFNQVLDCSLCQHLSDDRIPTLKRRTKNKLTGLFTIAMASPGALATSWDGDVSLVAEALRGTGRSLAFLDHFFEALQPQSRKIFLHAGHMLLVLLGELHG